MQTVGAHPVEVDPGHLEDGDAGIGCPGDGFSQAFIGFRAECDVERGGGYSRAQALHHGIAPEHQFDIVGLTLPALLLPGRLRGTLRRRMMGPVPGGRRGPLALETTTAYPARSDGRPLLGPGFTHCTTAFRVPGHYLV